MRRAGRSKTLALGAAAAALVACNILTGLDKDYALGTGPGQPPEDGGAGSDSGADTSTTSAPFDGDVEAAIAEAGADGSLCADATFCTDFEHSALNDAGLPSEFDGVNNNLGATIKVLPGVGTDGSAGLDVDSVTMATASRQAYLVRTIAQIKPATAFSVYELEFDFRVVSSDLSYAVVGLLNFTGATPEDHGVARYAGNIVGRLTPKADGVADDAAFHHAKIRLSRGDAGVFERTITVDGVDVDSPPSTFSLAGTSETEIRVGIMYTAGAPGRVHANLDNVVLRRF